MSTYKVIRYEGEDASDFSVAGLVETGDLNVIAVVPKHWPETEKRIQRLEKIAALANEARRKP